jgi:hypothetical protein
MYISDQEIQSNDQRANKVLSCCSYSNCEWADWDSNMIVSQVVTFDGERRAQ